METERPVRTRFAPSPTGNLHVGGARTAVLNWLFARHHAGAFVLRIEDTDLARNVAGAEGALLDSLRWLGLDWDEGPETTGGSGPYRQTERGDRYAAVVAELLERDLAYHCTCPPEDPREGEARAVRCPCADADPAERVASGAGLPVRFRVPRTEREVVVPDLVRGEVRFPVDAIEDFVLLRSDARPTYNLAAAADDQAMEISHVIRGVDHLANTPKQLLIYRALGWTPPRFAHVPLILGPDRQKLSKRHGASSVEALREMGCVPDAVVNYLSLLSWSSPSGEELLPRERLIREIDLDRVGRADAVFDLEKLRWLSFRYLQEMGAAELERRVRRHLHPQLEGVTREVLRPALEAVRPRISTLSEAMDHLAPLVGLRSPEEEVARRAALEDAGSAAVIRAVRGRLERVEEWRSGEIRRAIEQGGEDAGARGGGLFKPIRLALTGRTRGPELPTLVEALGRDRTLDLLDPVRSQP